MKNHTKLYLSTFYSDSWKSETWFPCEVCGQKGVDVHHIESRKAGGDPSGSKDNPANLMLLCRLDHEKYGDKKHFVDFLKQRHLIFVKNKGITLDLHSDTTKSIQRK